MDEEFCAVQSEAYAAYGRGLYREAALRYEQARRLAQAGERSDLAFSSAVEAAGCWHLGGQPHRGLSLVLEALTHVPPTALPRDVWQAKLRSFELMRCFRPDLRFLESCLSDLRVLSREQGMKDSGDILRLEALLYRARGRHEEALARFERAWHHIGNAGFHPYLIAYGAIFSALFVGDLSAVQRWSEVLHKMGDTSLEAQVAWFESQARVGLYTNQQDLACCMARELDKLVAKTQQPIWQRRVVMLKVRSWLLSPTQDDPMSLSHPMWKVFSQPIEGTPEVFDEYDRVLVLVDARIAALRYTLKVQPVDDMFYRQPQYLGTPKPSDLIQPDEIGRRVEACHWAIKRAVPIATTLDSAFCCGWRQAELEQRNVRIAELVEWGHGNDEPS
jgi:tetratricopeptide (TPR) repeat protein